MSSRVTTLLEEHRMTALADVTEDLAVAALAGYLATKAMEPVSMRLYELDSERDRQREDAVRPGPPYEIAARRSPPAPGWSCTASPCSVRPWPCTTGWP